MNKTIQKPSFHCETPGMLKSLHRNLVFHNILLILTINLFNICLLPNLWQVTHVEHDKLMLGLDSAYQGLQCPFDDARN